MNINRVFGSGSLILAGAFVALSVSGWVSAAQPTPEPLVRESVSISRPAMDEDVVGTESPYVEDAWESFDGTDLAELLGDGKAYRVTYVGTYSTEPKWGQEYVVVMSKTYLGTFHAFKINNGI